MPTTASCVVHTLLPDNGEMAPSIAIHNHCFWNNYMKANPVKRHLLTWVSYKVNGILNENLIQARTAWDQN